jgi:hypothetical protein
MCQHEGKNRPLKEKCVTSRAKTAYLRSGRRGAGPLPGARVVNTRAKTAYLRVRCVTSRAKTGHLRNSAAGLYHYPVPLQRRNPHAGLASTPRQVGSGPQRKPFPDPSPSASGPPRKARRQPLPDPGQAPPRTRSEPLQNPFGPRPWSPLTQAPGGVGWVFGLVFEELARGPPGREETGA